NLTAANFTAGVGTLASNYSFPTSASGAGHITAIGLTVSIIGDPTKPYDGNTNATLTSANYSVSGTVGTESFTVNQTAGTYNDANVTAANTVTANLTAANFTPGAGTLASNYSFPTSASGAGHITIEPTSTGITAPDVTYNGDGYITVTVTS